MILNHFIFFYYLIIQFYLIFMLNRNYNNLYLIFFMRVLWYEEIVVIFGLSILDFILVCIGNRVYLMKEYLMIT